MSKNKSTKPLFSGVIPLLFWCITIYPVQVQAQSFTNAIANKQSKPSDQQFPDDGDPTGRRRGGTSRGDCPSLKTPITALVAGEDTDNKSFIGSTLAQYPTFWVYLPELPNNIRSGEFVLQNQQGSDILRQAIALPGKSGIIGISLPQNPQLALRTNSKYHWYFNVYCDTPQKNSAYVVDAWVRRLAPTAEIQRQLSGAKSPQYNVYAANNIWYDAVNNLAQKRLTNPNDATLAEDWGKLLKSVGLSELTSAPIIQRYTVNR